MRPQHSDGFRPILLIGMDYFVFGEVQIFRKAEFQDTAYVWNIHMLVQHIKVPRGGRMMKIEKSGPLVIGESFDVICSGAVGSPKEAMDRVMTPYSTSVARDIAVW